MLRAREDRGNTGHLNFQCTPEYRPYLCQVATPTQWLGSKFRFILFISHDNTYFSQEKYMISYYYHCLRVAWITSGVAAKRVRVPITYP
ncbi:uncharacterized protein BJ212DRAFT_961974 [Suillus subaureus]|uniref:Uncharacterized protein n=1 Tax=Suillus subaureus TaxID=48587 RepID=A0A9P7EG66_9AGAM|nr:uncharacterized protein BJ212DRAFT_961974 [Suillus subaureus]KAG1820818.1 hypothetical protein BJ212DRAFT_961974 [Suillus subaureus]